MRHHAMYDPPHRIHWMIRRVILRPVHNSRIHRMCRRVSVQRARHILRQDVRVRHQSVIVRMLRHHLQQHSRVTSQHRIISHDVIVTRHHKVFNRSIDTCRPSIHPTRVLCCPVVCNSRVQAVMQRSVHRHRLLSQHPARLHHNSNSMHCNRNGLK